MADRRRNFKDLKMGDLPTHMTYAQIAEVMGIRLQSVYSIASDDPSFPERAMSIRSGVFDGEEVRRWLIGRSQRTLLSAAEGAPLLDPGKELFSREELAQVIGVTPGSLRTYQADTDRDRFPKAVVNPDTSKPYRPQKYARADVLEYAKFQRARLENRGRIPHELLVKFTEQ